MAQASKKGKLPKSAVRSLAEYCRIMASEGNDSAAEIFRRYLELMKKYEDFFFSKPWPEELGKPTIQDLDLSDEERKFLGDSKGYGERCDRFLVFCLRRSISLGGFDRECFEADDVHFGGRPCWDCMVHDAMRLREDIALEDRYKSENEEKMKTAEPSDVTREMYEHYNLPDVVRGDKMWVVKLRFYDEVGFTVGKNCKVKNMYKCPYGEESERLVEDGGLAKIAWELVEWYDSHWNRTHTVIPAACEMKWYHYDEPSVIDVTSYEDVMKATEDGRLLKILEERKMHEKETGSRY